MRTYLTHVAFICDDTVYNHRCRKWSLRTLARSTRDSSEICRLDARPTCDWYEPRAPGTTHILACASYGGSPQQSPRSRANCSRSCCSTQRRCISPLPFCKLVAAREFGQCWFLLALRGCCSRWTLTRSQHTGCAHTLHHNSIQCGTRWWFSRLHFICDIMHCPHGGEVPARMDGGHVHAPNMAIHVANRAFATPLP